MAKETVSQADGNQASDVDETSLVQRCQNGQASAFAELVRQYQDRIYNLIYRMCRQTEDAEELAQETFLKAFKHIHQFRGSSGVYTWLFRIAKNVTISHCRRQRKVKFLPLARAENDAPDPTDTLTAGLAVRRQPGPDAQAMSRETAERIAQALEALDEEHRVMVLLRDMEGMSYDEMSEVLELPAGTVKSRLHRARLALRDELSDLVES